MSISYNPKDANQCWDEGVYDAVIHSVEEKVSKTSGNDMWAIVFECYDGSNKIRVWDFIVNPGTLFRLKKLARALNALDQFEAGKFDPTEWKGANLQVELEIEDDKQFGEKNRVREYILSEKAATKPAGKFKSEQVVTQKPDDEAITEDDIPFDCAPTI